MVLLIHHAANCGHRFPPSSLSGLKACLEARARVIEVDIVALADGDFALAHDERLEDFSDGAGPVADARSWQLREIHHRWPGSERECVALLSEVVALLAAHPEVEELQLDLKPYAPLSNAILEALVSAIAPVKSQVRVTSPADWALRRLRALDGEVRLGFDPLLYLDLERFSVSEAEPPYRIGAYGYQDDHPLAARRSGAVSAYLAARAEALRSQVPEGTSVWYIRAAMLARALDDGFDWIAYLHSDGVKVAAWTLEPGQPHHVALCEQLMAAGVDRITTNDPPRLGRVLGKAAAW